MKNSLHTPKRLQAGILGTAISLFVFCNAFSQNNTWTPKANFPTTRASAVGFSIGNKGYIGTGFGQGIGKPNDFWEWDQPTDVWTQKANFAGPVRTGAVGFSIGTKGYIGTGSDGSSNPLGDFWVWEQATNTWTQNANFGGVARHEAVGFSIGTKGYVGTGQGGGYKQDFWEYDSSTDTWTQKATFAGGVRDEAVAFSIGTKGYIGTGRFQGSPYAKKDLWEWDQAANTWTQKADMGGLERYSAVGFSIGAKGYIGTGMTTVAAQSDDFWEWDQASNTWKQKANFGGGLRENAVGFSIGNKGYIGTGWEHYGITKPVSGDFWEYTPDTSCIASASISSDPSPNTTFCVGQNVYLSVSGGASYVWSTGETYANIASTLSATTTFSVTVTDVAGCTGTTAITFIVDPNCTTTGISQFNNGSLQSGIWPNPSNGIFTMDMGHGIATDAGMEIYNVFGERIYQSAVSGQPQSIDISGQPKGIYMLKLTSGKETAFAKIIIRQ